MELADYLDWPEWAIEQVEVTTEAVLIKAKPVRQTNVCSQCGELSTRVHRYYQRHVTNYP
jgi:hypothetical protein